MEAPWKRHGSTMHVLRNQHGSTMEAMEAHAPPQKHYGSTTHGTTISACTSMVVYALPLRPWQFHMGSTSFGLPRKLHGASMLLPCGTPIVLPWCFHGAVCASIRCHGASMGRPWWFRGVFMVLPRCCHRASMGLPLCFHGTFMVPPWSFHDASKVLPWCSLECLNGACKKSHGAMVGVAL